MLPVLLLLLLAGYCQGGQPTCPNGQKPKTDADGQQIQCLPGMSQRVTCGGDHVCYFSGMNYMCCPSNEPSPDRQPSCRSPDITVLDSNGIPMRCSPRTRTCPQESMTCSDVGSAFICCEKPRIREEKPIIPKQEKRKQRRPISGVAHLRKPEQKSEISEPSQKVKPTTAAPFSVECPSGAMGILNHNGDPVRCSSKKPCQGYGQFCYGSRKYSVCCEKYEFAADELDKQNEPPVECPEGSIGVLGHDGDTMYCGKRDKCNAWGQFCHAGEKGSGKVCCEKIAFAGTDAPISSFVEQKTPYKPKAVSIAVRHSQSVITNSIDESANLAPTDSALPEDSDKSRLTQVSVVKKTRKLTTSTTTTTTEAPIETTTEETTTQLPSTESTQPLLVFSPTTQPPAVSRPRAYAVRVDTRVGEDKIPLQSSRPSQLLNEQEKKMMAQQFLMHQIRNGWPYDDRYYRPDVDAFSPQQRSDIARLRFIDQGNQ